MKWHIPPIWGSSQVSSGALISQFRSGEPKEQFLSIIASFNMSAQNSCWKPLMYGWIRSGLIIKIDLEFESSILVMDISKWIEFSQLCLSSQKLKKQCKLLSMWVLWIIRSVCAEIEIHPRCGSDHQIQSWLHWVGTGYLWQCRSWSAISSRSSTQAHPCKRFYTVVEFMMISWNQRSVEY